MHHYRPKIINDFADVIGIEKADTIATHYAGRIVHISTYPSSALVKLVGVATAKILQDTFGRESIAIPLGDNTTYAKKKRTFNVYIDGGMSVTAAGQRLGVSSRVVWNWKKEYDLDGGVGGASLPLFDFTD